MERAFCAAVDAKAVPSDVEPKSYREAIVSVGACGSLDSVWTGAPVARICVLSKFCGTGSVPEYIDLGPADGWRYLRLFSPRRLPLQVRSYMLYYLRLFSPRRLPLHILRTLHASQVMSPSAQAF
jgi:hypothetical protein